MGEVGFDVGKKIKGRMRHILVDTLGMIVGLAVTSAAVQDRDGGHLLLESMGACLERARLIRADSAYAGHLVKWALCFGGWVMSKRSARWEIRVSFQREKHSFAGSLRNSLADEL